MLNINKVYLVITLIFLIPICQIYAQQTDEYEDIEDIYDEITYELTDYHQNYYLDNEYDYFSDKEEDVPLSFFWVSAGLGTAMYSRTGLSYGGSLAFAYSRKFSIGMQVAYFLDLADKIDALELSVLLRFYLQKIFTCSGPFIQVSCGQVLFYKRDEISFPTLWGSIYGSIDFGWRLILKDKYFIEPFIRGGYPFLYGGGFAAGIRF